MSEVWIRTTPNTFGTGYVVTIEASEDRAVTLTPDGVLKYASAVLHAAQYAEYDAAVYNQMMNVTKKRDLAGQMVVDLRRDRPPLDPTATKPLTLEPGVNPKGNPFLTISIDEIAVGQWTVKDAREHALKVMEAVFAADLDSIYLRQLMGLVGLEEDRARNVVEDVSRWRNP